MLSKEEIEKAKRWLNWMQKQDVFLPYISNILQYINQLEQENKKQNKIINEMAEWLIGFTFSDKNDLERIFCDKEEVKQYFAKKVDEK